MENKINVAELLKGCPKGMELDYALFEDTIFIGIEEGKHYPIIIELKDGGQRRLNKYGCHSNADYAKCVIFPKGKTTWEGFRRPFKDGDIVATNEQIFILQKVNRGTLNNCYKGTCYTGYDFKYKEFFAAGEWAFERHATEKEKEKLFDAIKENGYRWNEETKTLEKLFPYNIGTKVWVKFDKERKYIHTIVGISRNSFGNLEYEVEEEKTGVIVHYPERLLIPIETKEPKFKVGDKIKHKENGIYCTLGEYSEGISAYRTNIGLSITPADLEHWELVPNKFDITTLKPFKSKMLVRTENSDVWEGDIFVRYDRNATVNKFHCIGGWYEKCIPFKGNEWLLGTADDCNYYYKTWE